MIISSSRDRLREVETRHIVARVSYETALRGVDVRGWVILLVLALTGLAASCGGSEDNSVEPAENNREDAVGEETVQYAETIGLEGVLSSVAFGEGSVWVTDLGDYACDDTPGALPSGQGSSASCASPQEVLLKRIDPETREVLATIGLKASHVEVAAFGAGSVWTLSRDPASPSGSSGEVLRVDPGTNQIVGEIPVSDPGEVAFGEDSLWVTNVRDGTVSRIDPKTREVMAEIKVSAGGASDVAVDERSGTVWAANTASGPPGSFIPPEDYERGVRSEPARDAKLVRVDARTNRVVAEVPIENTAIEGGASSVDVGRDTVWVTSVNGKLFRVDPATNEVVAEVPLGDYSFDVEASEDGVWATSEVDVHSPASYTHRLTRVNPATNGVTSSVEIENVSGLALGDGAVWLTTGNPETGEGELMRYEP